MNAGDFLTLARRVVADPGEAAWRTAVSRAYYAAFHQARQFLADLGFRAPRSEHAHSYLTRRLQSAAADLPRVGDDLNDLRSERNRADYDLRQTVSQTDAVFLIVRAERLIEALDAARQEPTRTQITDTIKTYERDILKEETWRP